MLVSQAPLRESGEPLVRDYSRQRRLYGIKMASHFHADVEGILTWLSNGETTKRLASGENSRHNLVAACGLLSAEISVVVAQLDENKHPVSITTERPLDIFGARKRARTHIHTLSLSLSLLSLIHI